MPVAEYRAGISTFHFWFPAQEDSLGLRVARRGMTRHCLILPITQARFLEGSGRENSARPGSEVLRRELRAADRAEVVVNVIRRNAHRISRFIDILKQFIAWQIAAPSNDPGELWIFKFDDMLLSRFASKVKGDFRPFHVDMAVTKRGQSVGTIGAGVFGVTNTDQCCFEKTHDRCENFFTRQTAPSKIAVDAAANLWQGTAKSNHAVILVRIAYFSPIGVIAKLFSAASIAARCLKVTVFTRADPDLFPSRGNGKASDAPKERRIPDPFPSGIRIVKFLVLPSPRNSRHTIGYVAKTGFSGGSDNVSGRRFAILLVRCSHQSSRWSWQNREVAFQTSTRPSA